MPFKDISYLETLWLMCSVERNHLCNFGSGHYEECFCEIILNLDQRLRRCFFKNISYLKALVTFLFSGVEPVMQFS